MSKWNFGADRKAIESRKTYILKRVASGESKASIARKLGITPQRVGQIVAAAEKSDGRG